MSKMLKVAVIVMLIVALFRVAASIEMIVTGSKDLDGAVLFILNAVAIAGIALFALPKAEKWAWWTLLIIVMTPPIYCIFAHGWLGWNIVGIVISTVAMIIPAKEVFGKAAG